MEIQSFIKSVVDGDDMPVVICDKEHMIVYMNPEAVKRYEKRGGAKLVGKSIFDCHNEHSCEIIKAVSQRFAETPDLNKIFTYHKGWNGADSDIYMVALRNDKGEYMGYYEKHESRIHDASKPFEL